MKRFIIATSIALLALSLGPWAGVARAQAKKNLDQASYEGDLYRVKELVSGGAEVNAANRMNMTPLLVAAINNRLAICEYLIEHGADLNSKDRQGRTALFHAVEQKHKEVAELLVKKGADVNITAWNGDNAFSLAKKGGNTEMADFLAKNGAKDPVVQTDYGDEYYGGVGPSVPGPGGMPRPGMMPNMAQPAVEVNLLADPNEIMARLKTFSGLEKIILELGQKSSTETRYWAQTRYDNRTTLARAVEKQFVDELGEIKKVAVEEKAAKTTKAIDTMLEKTKDLYDVIGKELLQQRREAMASQSTRSGGRTRGSSRSPGRSGYSSRSSSGGYVAGGGVAGGGYEAYGDGGEMGVAGRDRYGRPGVRDEEPVDPRTQEEMRQWLAATSPDSKLELAKAIHPLTYADFAYLRGIAVEEKAEKTTAAIDGILLARQVRFDVYVKTVEALKQAEAAAQDPRLTGQPGDQNMQNAGRTRGRTRGTTSSRRRR